MNAENTYLLPNFKMIDVKTIVHFLLATMAVITINTNGSSQGAYVNLNGGYGLSMNPQSLQFFDFTSFTLLNSVFTEDQAFVSLGKGVSFGGSFGYMFNRNIGLELGVSYLVGSEYEATRINSQRTTDMTFSADMLRIIPSVVIASGFEKVNPYARFGVLIGSGSVLSTARQFDSGELEVRKWRYDGGVALGFSSGVGVLIGVSNSISLFGEINLVSLSYAPTQGELIEATLNGVDQLPDLTTIHKQIEFVDTYTYDYNNAPAVTEPNRVLKHNLPFGSIGLNLGLNIRFSKGSKSDSNALTE